MLGPDGATAVVRNRNPEPMVSRHINRSPSVYLSMFVGGSLAAAWISARPWDFIAAVCLGTASCAALLLFLLAKGFDQAIADYQRRRNQLARALDPRA